MVVVLGRSLLAALIALAATAAPASGFPAILTSRTASTDITQRLVERPATISVSESRERELAGSFLGFGTDPGPDFGPLTWTTYTDTEATATGIAWVTDCTARTCFERPFHEVPASVRAYAPNDGYFTRLTIEYTYAGRTVTEHTRVVPYPADDEGGRAHWGYRLEPPRYARCGSLRLHRRQGRRRGAVIVNRDVATCRAARRVARRAATRIAEVGNPLPAPRGWTCAGGFRPTLLDPRPSLIGCYRGGAAGAFLRSVAPAYQVAVR